MDLLGSFLVGTIVGICLCYTVIKAIAVRNKQKFLDRISNVLQNKIEGEAVLDAISGELDQLMEYHGEKIKIDKIPYYSCWVDGKHYMLPKTCISISNSEISN